MYGWKPDPYITHWFLISEGLFHMDVLAVHFWLMLKDRLQCIPTGGQMQVDTYMGPHLGLSRFIGLNAIRLHPGPLF